jgi:PAS domain S-box-containing protein
MASNSARNPGRSITTEDYAAILDSLVEGIVTLDGEGNIIGINRAACEILEVCKEEAVHANCCELLGSQLCHHAVTIREAIRQRRPIRDVQTEVQTRSGQRKVLVFQTRLLDRGGEHRGSVVLFRDISELANLREDVARRYRLHNIVGKSKAMQEVFRLIQEVADSDATVLIEGESGTGKELVAHAIHYLSPRSDSPLVAVNCSALAEGVLESELFGHVAGAFTGATRSKRGRFEAAAGGTIFLDEIGDLSPAVQVKLLRVLQERVVERVGAEESIPIDLRVIAATHRSLSAMVEKGTFRQDLYYRLRVVPIHLPPLRHRRDDLPLLAQHFVERFRRETGRPIEGLAPEALALLVDYAWPGNVRELENAVEYAFVKARGGLIAPEHLPPELVARSLPALPSAAEAPSPSDCGPSNNGTDDVRRILDETGWNVAKAARRLRLSRTTLYKRIAELGLRRPED